MHYRYAHASYDFNRRKYKDVVIIDDLILNIQPHSWGGGGGVCQKEACFVVLSSCAMWYGCTLINEPDKLH